MPVPAHPTAEKRAWIRDYLRKPENYSKTVNQVRAACKDHFGEVLGSASLNKVIMEMRRGVDTHPPPLVRGPPPVVVAPSIPQSALAETVGTIRATMEKWGIESIRIKEDGKMEVIMRSPD